ncbi:MAG TPA: DUF1329 domain-containing protein [Candidatus Binataceae bacterium]|nr:DUF1329 domain-containing protein [Candidatus Binataceae bacterium]
MKKAGLIVLSMLAALVLSLGTAVSWAQSYDPPAPMQRWLNATASQGIIQPGTKVTMQNWQQYRQFMPLGMQGLFEGKYFWRMPADVEMDVRQTRVYPLPRGYQEATERYGGQTRIVHLPNGHNDVQGYVAGRPFPNPQEPDKGYKILANVWFAYVPHLYVNTPENMANSCTQDRFGNISCSKIIFVYRQVGYNTDPGVQRDTPGTGDAWYTEWLMIEEPEQSKYTANLLIFHKNNELPQDSYVFVPALRRSLRLAVSARCAPVAGSDFVQDDYNTKGFNGGLALFNAKYLGTRKILALANDYANITGDFPKNWDMPLGLSKPSWGSYELRTSDIIDVRRVPSEIAGYCYGSRIMYVDRAYTYGDWIDIYDDNMQLWKMFGGGAHVVDVPLVGRVVTNSVVSSAWDVQNDHASYFSSIDTSGHEAYFNQTAPQEYQNLQRYSTPAGLMQILR